MKTSQFFLNTLKDNPSDADLVSQRLMVRAGLIHKLGSGLFTWMPLGFRVLQKVEAIVREEMNRIGALQIVMPNVQPAELWQETGRWNDYGTELLKIVDRHERAYVFAPTHEEVITHIARGELRSYKQLPVCFYQIHTKFRDEIRPRFGVMRAREFLMKDAYSFHLDNASLAETYQKMYDAYTRIFTRLGLDFRAVEADTGSIGGAVSHEFQVIADAGEDALVFSDSSNYGANLEKAEALAPKNSPSVSQKTKELIHTPGKRTIKAVCEFLKLPETQSIKVLLVKGTENDMVALVLRGDHEVNPIKAEHHPLIAVPFTFADEKLVESKVGCAVGYLGPIGLTEKNIPVIVDRDAAVLTDFCCGANQVEYHLVNVNWQRDCPLGEVFDLRNVVTGDLSPDGNGTLVIKRGIEVGHIFQLGNKYSTSMNATVVDEKGQPVMMQMGCYGIGVSRTIAAAIEQHHDEHGIVWPTAMAPFQIALVPMNYHKSQRVREATDTLYRELQEAGFEVLLDDRNERAGVLFADMDLIGIPHRLVLGERGLDNGLIEYKARVAKEVQEVKLTDLMSFLDTILRVKHYIE
ncbi:MAG: proline--tRNA ligase [Gammaproteobacteria bacterium]|nr:proline--tRNA ligase [Gammaproteobacteria bacterium]